MNMKTKATCLFILFCLWWMAIPFAYTQTNVDTLINDPKLLQVAQAMKGSGVLQMDKRHYVYLAVSDAFIDALYPLLYQQLDSNEKKCLAPVHNKHGSHISIFYPNELNIYQIDKLPINTIYYFQVVNIHKFNVNKDSKHIVWFVIEIKSLALNEMIRKFRPISKNNSMLHISIARAKYNADNSCYAPTFHKTKRSDAIAP